MRKSFLRVAVCCTAIFFLNGCQKEIKDYSSEKGGDAGRPAPSTSCNYTCADYQVSLQKSYANGQTTFIWTIVNPCPGNGNNGTLQNLSHWALVPGQCLSDNYQSIIGAEYNQGAGWVVMNPLPVFQPDPSMVNQGCNTGNVFKFPAGTNGSTPTQYKLVLIGNWGTDDLSVFFKSGANTGCCSASFRGTGVGCPEQACSLSQGYWFANNPEHPNGVHPWGGDGTATVTIGGYVYTNAEGLAIWNTSNSGGLKDSKKAFTQLAALNLSGVDLTNPAISGYVTTIECWLGSIAKLSPSFLPNQTATEILACGNAAGAAGAIGNWIEENHCE